MVLPDIFIWRDMNRFTINEKDKFCYTHVFDMMVYITNSCYLDKYFLAQFNTHGNTHTASDAQSG